MPRFNDAPVTKEKIQLITDLLNSPVVNELYLKFASMPTSIDFKLIKQREDAFQAYAIARDEFLGLKPLKIEAVQGTHKRYQN